jgi:hypothetical protein
MLVRMDMNVNKHEKLTLHVSVVGLWSETALPNESNFIDDLPRMLPTKFRFIWQSGYREDFLEVNQSETRIVCGGHVC